MTRPVTALTTQEKIDHARGYLASAEKSIHKGNKKGAKQTLSRVLSYVEHAMNDLR